MFFRPISPLPFCSILIFAASFTLTSCKPSQDESQPITEKEATSEDANDDKGVAKENARVNKVLKDIYHGKFEPNKESDSYLVPFGEYRKLFCQNPVTWKVRYHEATEDDVWLKGKFTADVTLTLPGNKPFTFSTGPSTYEIDRETEELLWLSGSFFVLDGHASSAVEILSARSSGHLPHVTDYPVGLTIQSGNENPARSPEDYIASFRADFPLCDSSRNWADVPKLGFESDGTVVLRWSGVLQKYKNANETPVPGVLEEIGLEFRPTIDSAESTLHLRENRSEMVEHHPYTPHHLAWHKAGRWLMQLGYHSLSNEVMVTGVLPYSAALKAGLQPGDIIEMLDNQNIPAGTQLDKIIPELQPSVDIRIRRGRITYETILPSMDTQEAQEPVRTSYGGVFSYSSKSSYLGRDPAKLLAALAEKPNRERIQAYMEMDQGFQQKLANLPEKNPANSTKLANLLFENTISLMSESPIALWPRLPGVDMKIQKSHSEYRGNPSYANAYGPEVTTIVVFTFSSPLNAPHLKGRPVWKTNLAVTMNRKVNSRDGVFFIKSATPVKGSTVFFPAQSFDLKDSKAELTDLVRREFNTRIVGVRHGEIPIQFKGKISLYPKHLARKLPNSSKGFSIPIADVNFLSAAPLWLDLKDKKTEGFAKTIEIGDREAIRNLENFMKLVGGRDQDVNLTEFSILHAEVSNTPTATKHFPAQFSATLNFPEKPFWSQLQKVENLTPQQIQKFKIPKGQKGLTYYNLLHDCDVTFVKDSLSDSGKIADFIIKPVKALTANAEKNFEELMIRRARFDLEDSFIILNSVVAGRIRCEFQQIGPAFRIKKVWRILMNGALEDITDLTRRNSAPSLTSMKSYHAALDELAAASREIHREYCKTAGLKSSAFPEMFTISLSHRHAADLRSGLPSPQYKSFVDAAMVSVSPNLAVVITGPDGKVRGQRTTGAGDFTRVVGEQLSNQGHLFYYAILEALYRNHIKVDQVIAWALKNRENPSDLLWKIRN